MEDFAFICVCDAPAEPPRLAEGDWATIVGYGDNRALRWYENKELARTGNDFKMLAERPQVGGSYWLHLTYPFAAAQGESFWCIHAPPSFRYNDLDADDDMTQFSFVRCSVSEMEIISPDVRNERGFWDSRKAGVARATVEAIMTLDDLLKLPLSDAPVPDVAWDCLNFAGLTTILRQGSFVYIMCHTNVDWGIWAIVHDTPEATDLLVFCEDYQHADTMRLGRSRLRDGERMIGAGVPEGWLNAPKNPHVVER